MSPGRSRIASPREECSITCLGATRSTTGWTLTGCSTHGEPGQWLARVVRDDLHTLWNRPVFTPPQPFTAPSALRAAWLVDRAADATRGAH